MPDTGLVIDRTMEIHRTREGHPESPARLERIRLGLERSGLASQCVRLPPIPASMEIIQRCHSAAYLTRLQNACRDGRPTIDCDDSSICPESFDIARLAAGSVVQAIDAVMSGRVTNAYCGIRPPGHHAERERSMGFCLLSNAAIGAQYLIDRYDLKRVLVFDWDVHHGNGTQQIHESNPQVMFGSIHADPAVYYPYTTGHAHEIGLGAARGNTINIPMPLGSFDDDYKRALCEMFLPRIETFQPQFILISAGFDAHRDDPMQGMKLSTDFFTWITNVMTDFANRYCEGRLVSIQEGGYNTDTLAGCVNAHTRALLRASRGGVR